MPEHRLTRRLGLKAGAALMLGVIGTCSVAIPAEDGLPEKSNRLKIGHPPDVYGKELSITKNMGVGPTMAARVVGERLYSIGRGRLHIFDISQPADPKLLGSLDGLGATRQIEVEGRVAYITAREDGVLIVDVGDPRKPKLLCHYDPIEVATGMDVSGDVMFVACRSHGVELVDVSDPKKPQHLATARTGEAQSVEVRGGYAYVGVWGSRELVVVDVRNPRKPVVTVKCPLDGNGDGVAVRGEYVYVATGHHSRARTKPYPDKDDPAYGRGHGLEIFRITNPARPEFVSRIKMPPFYRIGNDMWGVKIAGDYAFVHDTHNGLFVVDVSNPEKPSFVAHRQLDVVDVPLPKYMGTTRLPGFVGGLALADGYVYLAGGWTDLHVVAASGLAKPSSREPETPPVIPPYQPEPNRRFHVYRPGGQVRAVSLLGETAVVAAGSAGVCLVRLSPEPVELGRYPTQGFAMEVKTHGDKVYVAEEKGGLSIWRHAGDDKLAFAGRYAPRGQIVKDVVVPAPGKYAVVQVDMAVLDVVDISNPKEPKRVFRDKGHGFVYHLGEDLIDGRLVCVLFQLGGLRFYDLYGTGSPGFSGLEYPHRLGGNGTVSLEHVSESGTTAFQGRRKQWIDGLGRPSYSQNRTAELSQDTHSGERSPAGGRLVIHRGGLLTVTPQERRPPSELRLRRLLGHALSGKPLREGNRLYISDSRTGEVNIVNISDVEKPTLIEHFNIPGNPARLVLHKGALIIPNGYEGLWVERKR